MKLLALSLVAALAAFTFTACGSDDDGGCPGITCTNCGGLGDCNVSCSPGQTEYCIAHPADSNLRCAYCE